MVLEKSGITVKVVTSLASTRANLASSTAATLDLVQFVATELGGEVLDFLAERHLATLALTSPDEPLHVTPVGFSWDDELQIARVITFAAARKVRLISRNTAVRAALTQVDGGRWLTLYGEATVCDDPAVNADAELRYAIRYQPPNSRGNDRRTIQVKVDRIIGRC